MPHSIVDTLVTFTLLGLIIRGVGHLLVNEPGPFNIFGKWREMLGITINGIPKGWEELTEMQKLFSCQYCLSFWLALIGGLGLVLINEASVGSLVGLFAAYAVAIYDID